MEELIEFWKLSASGHGSGNCFEGFFNIARYGTFPHFGHISRNIDRMFMIFLSQMYLLDILEVILIRTPDVRTPDPDWPDQSWRSSARSEIRMLLLRISLLGPRSCEYVYDNVITMSNRRMAVLPVWTCIQRPNLLDAIRPSAELCLWNRTQIVGGHDRIKAAACTCHLIWSLFWLQRHLTASLRLKTETVCWQNSYEHAWLWNKSHRRLIFLTV